MSRSASPKVWEARDAATDRDSRAAGGPLFDNGEAHQRHRLVWSRRSTLRCSVCRTSPSPSPFSDPDLGLAVLQSLVDAELASRPDRDALRRAHPPTEEHPNAPLRASLVDGLTATDLERLTDLAWRPYDHVRFVCNSKRRRDEGVYALTSRGLSAEYRPRLAAALDLVALCNRQWGHEERRAALAEAAEVHREVAAVGQVGAQRRGRRRAGERGHVSQLCYALAGLGTRLRKFRRHVEAVGVVEEGLAAARQVADREPRLTGALLDRLHFSYTAHGRHDEALTAATEAVEVFRTIVTTDRRNGRAWPSHWSTWAASTEAVDLYRHLVAADEEQHSAGLADSLTDHATVLSRNGRDAEAVTAATEALPIYRRLAVEDPVRYEPELARVLRTFAEVDADGAVDAARESVTLYERLATKRPAAFDTHLRTARDVLERLS